MRTRRRRAFTLVEVLVVAAIIGILAAIALTVYPLFIRKSQLTKTQWKVSSLAMAINRYRTDMGRYPEPGQLIAQLTSRQGVDWAGPYLSDLDADDRGTLSPQTTKEVEKRAVIFIVNEDGSPARTSPVSSSPNDLDGLIVGEPGYGDAYGRRMIYLPYRYYATGFSNADTKDQWQDIVHVPYFGAPKREKDIYGSETGFRTETPFDGPGGRAELEAFRYHNMDTFQIIAAGYDGKLVVSSDKYLVPLVWNNNINDDGGEGFLPSLNERDGTDDYYSRSKFLEDDVVNF